MANNQSTPTQVLQTAKDRGYSVMMSSPDKSWYSMYHEEFGINCELYPHKNNFTLTYMHGMVAVTTGECGSFMNDVHFLRIQRQIYDAVLKLKA